MILVKANKKRMQPIRCGRMSMSPDGGRFVRPWFWLVKISHVSVIVIYKLQSSRQKCIVHVLMCGFKYPTSCTEAFGLAMQWLWGGRCTSCTGEWWPYKCWLMKNRFGQYMNVLGISSPGHGWECSLWPATSTKQEEERKLSLQQRSFKKDLGLQWPGSDKEIRNCRRMLSC